MFQYNTIKYASEAEYKDKGSKFIAYAIPFRNEIDLKNKLESIKLKHSKARHFCYAYKIGTLNDNFRANDDGEPSGTAGKPILNAILSKNLSDTLIIVVRYFGGTLLGASGLISAYKSVSILALEKADIETIFLKDVYVFHFHFENLNDLMKLVKVNNLVILKQDYDPNCIFEIEIKRKEAHELIQKFKELRMFKITIKD